MMSYIQHNQPSESTQTVVKGMISTFIAGKCGEEVTQADLAKLLNVSRGAAAKIPVNQLPKHKTGSARTSRVFYKPEEVANYIQSKANEVYSQGKEVLHG